MNLTVTSTINHWSFIKLRSIEGYYVYSETDFWKLVTYERNEWTDVVVIMKEALIHVPPCILIIWSKDHRYLLLNLHSANLTR